MANNGMQEPSSATPGEVSISDIARTLKKRWPFVAVFTVCVGIAAAIYYTNRRELSEAEMLLDETKYELEFASHTRAIAPHWHHMELGKSSNFLQRVEARMRNDPMWGAAMTQAKVRDIFSLNDRGGRSGPVVIKAQQPSPEAANKALDFWAEEFIKVAPVYRARRLLRTARAEMAAREKDKLELIAVSAGLSNRLARIDGSRAEDELYRKAIRAKLVDLDIERLVFDFQGAFRNEVAGYLTQIANSTSFDDVEAKLKHASDAADNALVLVQAGRDEMMSAPQSLNHPAQIPAKVLAMVLTGLILSSIAVVFFDWYRQGTVRGEEIRK
jgi:hypothetical protein